MRARIAHPKKGVKNIGEDFENSPLRYGTLTVQRPEYRSW
jgi:hypothetical protein